MKSQKPTGHYFVRPYVKMNIQSTKYANLVTNTHNSNKKKPSPLDGGQTKLQSRLLAALNVSCIQVYYFCLYLYCSVLRPPK